MDVFPRPPYPYTLPQYASIIISYYSSSHPSSQVATYLRSLDGMENPCESIFKACAIMQEAVEILDEGVDFDVSFLTALHSNDQ